MRVLVLGASGMLGSAVLNALGQDASFEVFGTLRSASGMRYFAKRLHSQLISDVNVLELDTLVRTLENVKPDVVINCVGLIKQFVEAKDPLIALPLNSLFPHRLARLCGLAGIRLVHVSTDCVFSGCKGMYKEDDVSDAEDLYGKSKFLGELHHDSHAITLRTSIIGHELNSSVSLVDWFLSQQGSVKGYVNAIFSGLPTAELASVIKHYVLTRPELAGLYHVAADPISKHALLNLIAAQYGKVIEIVPDERVVIDRSLDAQRFNTATGYVVPGWKALIQTMFETRTNTIY
ncbi:MULTISPECIES: SDR family oxidoreductase [unclassified Pseudomonas]|uniref:dTDP-4-dehydrorhamnose reductase family protein n=1 Tax=unclassified Pseudomonas TaxID=196821 RepID=UPI0020970FFA|nr:MULTISPECIES: SDR family oxidoreductase [unclassified Pseudomonas]MCO7506512.1 SDR family oxidoreductase [Pseudomonas sp. VE 267-6A]MCO7531779.1 SDR family oxidoreductase [Pseudomonas sp. 2]